MKIQHKTVQQKIIFLLLIESKLRSMCVQTTTVRLVGSEEVSGRNANNKELNKNKIEN